MGRATAWLVALPVLLTSGLLYREWLSVTVPQGIPDEDKFQAKVIHMLFSLVGPMENLAGALGIPLSAFKKFVDLFVNLTQTGWPLGKLSDKEVEVRYDVWEGVPIKIYEKLPSKASGLSKPALVYFHGGGFKWFSYEFGDPTVREIARRLDVMVISVDYRLAPEHPFPAAFDDCLAATTYVLREHARLGVRLDAVMVGGDSAGGNLAAAVAARLKKRLRLQVLIYPVLQALDFRTPSYLDNARPFVISADGCAHAVLTYANMSRDYKQTLLSNQHLRLDVREKYARYVHSDLLPEHLKVTERKTLPVTQADSVVSDVVNSVILQPSFMPLMADSLDDLPDAYVVTAQYDILRDDGIMYAQRLTQAKNVKVKLEHYYHAFHGFFYFRSGPLSMGISKTAVENLVNFLQNHLVS